MSDDFFLTRVQLAELLHCSIRTIHNYQNAGTLPPPTRLGRRHLWLKSDLLAFIKAQKSVDSNNVHHAPTTDVQK